MASSRRYCFTIFISEERSWDKESVDRVNVKYLVAQQELCPETNRLHWQGYVEFGKPARIPQAKEWLSCEWANLRIANGDRKANYVYCTKEDSRAPDGERFEIGIFEEGGQGRKKSSTATIREEIRNGTTTLRQEITEGRVLSTGVIRFLERVQSELDRGCYRGAQTATYLFGPSNQGKSHLAHGAFEGETFYSKDPTTKWWDGYNGEANIIVDDWSGPSTQEELDRWKRWIDKWPCQVETKGGYVWLKTKAWIFTSNVNWTALPVFFDQALKRRFDPRFPNGYYFYSCYDVTLRSSLKVILVFRLGYAR